MSAFEQGFLLISGMFVLLALGFPIALALLSSGVIGLIAMRGWSAADYLLGSLPYSCLLYTSPSPRDRQKSRMPSSA